MFSHLPDWARKIISSKFLIVEEEAWNSYPYTKTIYTCSFLKSFKVEIETRYFDEPGLKTNVFNLNEEDLRNVQIDYVDIVRDQLPASEYVREEDPLYFTSKKTGRGPLTESWLQEYTDEYNEAVRKGVKPRTKIMCAYKLCKVHCSMWGMGYKIEKFIHDFGGFT